MREFEYKLKKEVEVLTQKEPEQTQGKIFWKSPSNIAIVKYWGKYPGQIPANASLSLTLSETVTKTSIEFNYSNNRERPEIEFELEGEENADFLARITRYLKEIEDYLPWLRYTDLKIKSENTFPHSSGIASSASSMSALAAGLCNIEDILFKHSDPENFHRKVSFLARLGSGSASRSVFGKMSVWGQTSEWSESSDEYAIPVTLIHNNFIGMKDSILIIESGKKELPSSLGHRLMKTNHYAKMRFEAAEENMQKLSTILKNGDMYQFIDILENEALSLHAMMMTSSPGYILMKPNSLEAIQRIRNYRNRTGISIGFTLDAGANVHVLYPKAVKDGVRYFIDLELKPLCENGRIIHDEMGEGVVPFEG